MSLQIITEEFRDAVSILDTTALPGFIFLENHTISGVVTYHIENNECEIVTLNSFRENRGIGTALIRCRSSRRPASELQPPLAHNDQ